MNDRDRAALRVERRHDLLDRPVLARRVDALEHDEDRPFRLGPEPVLEVGQAVQLAVQLRGGSGLVVAVVGRGIELREPDAGTGSDEQRVPQVGRSGHLGSSWVVQLGGRDVRCDGTATSRSRSRRTHGHRRRRQAAPDLPRRPLGRVGRPARHRQPGRPEFARGLDLPRHRCPVRGGRRGRRRRVRGHPARCPPTSVAGSCARSARASRPGARNSAG